LNNQYPTDLLITNSNFKAVKRHLFVSVIFLGLVLSYISLSSQKIDSIPSVCLNHILIYLDSATYQNLFNSSVLSDTIGNCETDTVTTVNQKYSGKYLFGEEGYLEFFPTKEVNTIPPGTFGFGFITFRTGDIWKIRNEWQKHATETIWTDTTFKYDKGLRDSWYYSIGIDPIDTSKYYPVWLMENTPEHMNKAGYTDSDLKEEITWGTYHRKLRKSEPFSKLLKSITSVNISVDNDGLNFLKKNLQGFGLRQMGTTFLNQYVNISCDIKPYYIWRIQTITFELKQDVAYRKLIINDNLTLELEGKSAVMTFN
jgi:Family of unknown function (DUF5829)